MNRKERLLHSVVSLAHDWMDGGQSVVTPPVECAERSAPEKNYYLHVSLITPSNLLIQEFTLGPDGANVLFRLWTFRKEREWDVFCLEKNKSPVYLRDLEVELEDLATKMQLIQRVMAPPGYYHKEEVAEVGVLLSPPRTPEDQAGFKRLLFRIRDHFLRPAVFAPMIGGGVLFLTVLATAYAVNLGKIQREVDGSINDYIVQLESKIGSLYSFSEEARTELQLLKGNLAKEKTNFEFNRRNAQVNVLRLAEELPSFFPARKEAYRTIAASIMDTVTYGEIIYEMSRIPTSESQARIFLATAPTRILPLGRLTPVIAGVAYPAELKGKGNDGFGFRITDGFMEERMDPFGSGGSSPHYAIDIINVANISFVSYEGKIIRSEDVPGMVVAVEDGFVRRLGLDEIYGWNIEVEHPISEQVKAEFPDATGWSSFYAHLHQSPAYNVGDWVERREQIGEIGSTGRSTGPHLHLEFRIFLPDGIYWTEDGRRYNKISPYREVDGLSG